MTAAGIQGTQAWAASGTCGMFSLRRMVSPGGFNLPGPHGCRLRGGSADTWTEPTRGIIDDADIVGDVLGESEEALTIEHSHEGSDASTASEASVSAVSSGIDPEGGHRVWGQRKMSVQEMQERGSRREVWKGAYWANLIQKQCEMRPTRSKKEKAEGITPKSILWGDECAEALMDTPPGYFRPYGDAIPINDTYIGSYPDGTPALLRDVCCGSGDTTLLLDNCYAYSDSRECIDEQVAAYRANRICEKNAAEGNSAVPNPYITTGWGHPKHPGGPPEEEEFDPQKHRGYTRWCGKGGTPPPSQEELLDEFSDGKWGVDHYEVGRWVPMVKAPLNQQRFWRPGKAGRAEEAEVENNVDWGGGGDLSDDGEFGLGFDAAELQAGDEKVRGAWRPPHSKHSASKRKGEWAGGGGREVVGNDDEMDEDSRDGEGDGGVHEEGEEGGQDQEAGDDAGGESVTVEEAASPGNSEVSGVETSTAPLGYRTHPNYRKGMGDKERWAMMGKSGRRDPTRSLIEGHEFDKTAGGIAHQINSWNYSKAEEERNELLLDQKWRRWRREFESNSNSNSNLLTHTHTFSCSSTNREITLSLSDLCVSFSSPNSKRDV